ncbi:Chitooligosaccharide deacetylase [Neolecta irregularis DAH-3]|uniref:chitin deacetylase n=1 Tax=Neolecta irregularis (strain DAH-3) TaxID=1198029 RepID=A0A1U7LLG6_NEOID|nr:Chitooligosaccharide deacetylase [Neolecta irregularis DAH-3]|eukprot:OLL23433.1 Chitooligosaccharide deacetylase [Neolecta irregularis DAH-3]
MLLLSILLCIPLFCLPLYIVYKPPQIVIRALARRYPDVLWFVDVVAAEKVIALTIDDAPSRFTPEILRLLRDHDSHATFFCIGSQVTPNSLQAIISQGHELGNHAMRDEASVDLPPDKLRVQIEQVDEMIDEAYSELGIERQSRFFRPGFGFFSNVMIEMVQSMGYQTVLGNVYPHDAQIPYPKINARHILSMVQPGSIIIVHDRREYTTRMLQVVLPALKRRGYEIVTMSHLLSLGKSTKRREN